MTELKGGHFFGGEGGGGQWYFFYFLFFCVCVKNLVEFVLSLIFLWDIQIEFCCFIVILMVTFILLNHH